MQLIMPEMNPIRRAIPPETSIAVHEPIATPPAKVAFWKIYMSLLPPFIILEHRTAEMQLPVIARMVLIIIYCWDVSGARQELKLGQ